MQAVLLRGLGFAVDANVLLLVLLICLTVSSVPSGTAPCKAALQKDLRFAVDAKLHQMAVLLD